MEQSRNVELEPLLKAHEAAPLLGVAALTLKRMAHQGLVPSVAFPIGRTGKHTYRFRKSDLKEYLDSLQLEWRQIDRVVALATYPRRVNHDIR